MRYVILFHETPPDYPRPPHWDLMLEDSGRLWTWALSAEPQIGATIAAEQLPDHRLDYLDFEGSLSGNRGFVTRFDRGTYRRIATSDSELQLELLGPRLACQVSLRRLDPTLGRWQITLT